MFGKRTQNMIVFFAFEKHLQHSGAFFPLPLHWRGLGARPPIVPVQKRKRLHLGHGQISLHRVKLFQFPGEPGFCGVWAPAPSGDVTRSELCATY